MTPAEARAHVLSNESESEWSEHVKRWAFDDGWCGVHIRRSLTTGRGFSVFEGVHTLRNSDHDDGRGIPDWLFIRKGGPLLLPELKTVRGHTSPDQDRWLDLLASAERIVTGVWRPTDAEQIVPLLFEGHR